MVADDPSLRLLARTLIEWKTPKETQIYSDVLSDLVRLNPDIRPDQITRLVSLDDHGIVLWYLSESLRDAANVKINFRKYRDEDLFQILGNGAIQTLLDIARLNDRLWPAGPRQKTVADSVISTLTALKRRQIDINHPSARHASRVLIAIAIPLPLDVLRDNCEKLLRITRGSRTYLEFSRYIKTVTNLTRQGSNRYIAATTNLAKAGSLSAILAQVAATAMGAVLAAGLSSVVFWLVPLTLSLSGVLTLLNKGKIEGLVQRKILGSDRISAELDAGSVIKPALNEVCASNPHMLSHILERSTLTWGLAALMATDRITTATAKEAMALIRVPELTWDVRANIFQWLCWVRIEADNPQNK